MAIDKHGIPFHPSEYNPDYPRIKCKICGLMNSCEHGLTDVEPWYPRLPILLEGGMVQSIDDFILDLGHPFKKQSQFGYAIIQQGKLNEFVLDQGYPTKIKPSSTKSNFKIIGEY